MPNIFDDETLPQGPEDENLLRLPGVLKMHPVSKSGWYRGMAEGKYPRPIKLGPRVRTWKKRWIRVLNYWAEQQAEEQRQVEQAK